MATRVTKHASPLLLKRGVRGETGQIMEIRLQLPTAPAYSATGFERDSAFPGPALLAAMPEFVLHATEAPEARLMVFGHADEAGSESHNKKLGDLRAKAVLALLTLDLTLFDQVAKADDWQLVHYQAMLKALGLTPMEVDGKPGPKTSSGVKRFQQAYSAGAYHPEGGRARAHDKLKIDGELGPRTEAALRDAYLGQLTAGLDAARFFGPKFAGCGEFNRMGSAEQDRRVVLTLYRPDFPTESKIPCKEGDAGACAINRKAKHPWLCNFYRRTIETETLVVGSFQPVTSGVLQSLVARDRLTRIAKEHSRDQFARWLTSVFGTDIPSTRYAELHTELRNETLPHPAVVLLPASGLKAHPGAYNRQEKRIEIAEDLVSCAAAGQSDAVWLLLAVLIEEFGHYLDDWLREGQGDSKLDEGARFGYALVNLEVPRDTPAEFAVYTDPVGAEFPIEANWSQLHDNLDHLFDEEAQRSDEMDSKREYFGPAPAADRLRAGAQLAMLGTPADRVATMSALAPRFGIPHGAWTTGQSRLFVGGDVRIAALLRRLASEKASKAAAVNLSRAERHTGMDPYLVLTTAARENESSVTAQGSNMIDTWREGGLDFLWKNRSRLGLPVSVTKNWKPVTPFKSPETGNIVEPGLVPARDQVLGYAAQTRLSFSTFERHVRSTLGDALGGAAIAALAVDARAVWQAYAFLAPGGTPFEQAAGIQHGQKFGVKSAFGYLLDKASRAGRAVDLNEVIYDSAIDGTDYVRIAKARAAEAAFIADYVNTAATSSATGAATGGP